MRLFTGIDLPAEIAAKLQALLDQFRALAPLRWSKVENLHVTTKFIGEWPEDKLDEMTTALRQVPVSPPSPISLSGLGWFPNPHRPRIFWVGVQAPQSLADLARDTDKATAALGVAVENRPYSPHLTLARIEQAPPPDLSALRQAIATMDVPSLGSFECRAFHLYLSEPSPRGSRYTKLASFPLEVR